MKSKFDYLRIQDLEDYPENRTVFEKGTEEILTGKCYAYKDRFGIKSEIKLSDGTRFTNTALLEFFLNQQTKAGFNYEQGVEFCEKYRKLATWKTYTDRILMGWFERVVMDTFFIAKEISRYRKNMSKEKI